MPNWCQNHLTVEGNDSDIAKLVESEFDFQKLRPCPYMDDTDKPTKKWFWCMQYWSTRKINTEHIDWCNKTPTELSLKFDTAWSPCFELLKYLTAEMPSLTMVHRYFESGIDIAGECHYKDGVATEINIEQTTFVRQHFNSEYGLNDEDVIE